jgi:DNA (cytosine-5)-methyltransferase 1
MEKELQNKRYRIRKLTPRECFRLMDVCESDIDKIQASGVSESQQYKMAGNSIVVSVMALTFKNLFSNEQPEEVGQLTLF